MSPAALQATAAVVDRFQEAVLEMSRWKNPTTEEGHRFHDQARDVLEATRGDLLKALVSVCWDTNPQGIPFSTPVLVMTKDGKTPFMATRDAEFDSGFVNILLGDDSRGYGITIDINDLERWADVVDERMAA